MERKISPEDGVLDLHNVRLAHLFTVINLGLIVTTIGYPSNC